MKRWKQIYCGLLAAWLLFCAGRTILCYAGGYSNVLPVGEPYYLCDGPDNTAACSKTAAAEFADLNAQLEAAQPGTQFFYAPHKTYTLTYRGLLCTPAPGATPRLSPAAEKVFETWNIKNGFGF